MPGGALGVPEGNAVVPIANRLAKIFELTVATQDWHPRHHQSFITAHPEARVGDLVQLSGRTQIVWPVHCVQNTSGADLHDDLNRESITEVFPKEQILRSTATAASSTTIGRVPPA